MNARSVPGWRALRGDESPVADAVRQEFTAHLARTNGGAVRRLYRASPAHDEIHRGALQAARQAVLAMRASDEIGDDAFHQIEEELDRTRDGG